MRFCLVTVLCFMVFGLTWQSGSNAFAPSPRRQKSIRTHRFMSQQQPARQPQQLFDQNGNPVSPWNTAVDPASGNTYWYNIYTGDTSWNPPGATPLPPPQQSQQQQPNKTMIGAPGTKRNPDADRVVNKADVYLAMLKQDSTTRTMARHYGDIEASNQVFTDPQIESIKNMVIDNPYVEKSKELVETSDEEVLPIMMLPRKEHERETSGEKAQGPKYKEQLEKMKNKRKGGQQ